MNDEELGSEECFLLRSITQTYLRRDLLCKEIDLSTFCEGLTWFESQPYVHTRTRICFGIFLDWI